MVTKGNHRRPTRPGRKIATQRPRAAVARTSSAPRSRVICVECGRELWISDLGAAERVLYCCGRVMTRKK